MPFARSHYVEMKVRMELEWAWPDVGQNVYCKICSMTVSRLEIAKPYAKNTSIHKRKSSHSENECNWCEPSFFPTTPSPEAAAPGASSAELAASGSPRRFLLDGSLLSAGADAEAASLRRGKSSFGRRAAIAISIACVRRRPARDASCLKPTAMDLMLGVAWLGLIRNSRPLPPPPRALRFVCFFVCRCES